MESRILQELYEAYGTEIRRYLCGLTGNQTLAEELCQETFLKALLSLPDGHTNMRAWLYMVARNLYFNYRKKEKRVQSGLDELEAGNRTVQTGNVHGASGAGTAWESDVLEQVLSREKETLLREALLTLSLQKREVIMMQYYGGMKLKEIAKILGLSPENTRVLAHRAKQELRKYMEVNGYDLS